MHANFIDPETAFARQVSVSLRGREWIEVASQNESRCWS